MLLGKVIADYRYLNRLSVRQISAEIGISQGTLNRFERGEHCDATSFVKILYWLFAGEPERRRRRVPDAEEKANKPIESPPRSSEE